MLTESPSKEDIERVVTEEIHHVLEDKSAPGAALPAVGRDDRLGDLGLSSLDLAQLVAGLEASLKADPFQELVAITSVRTVADLCSAYERFFSGDTSQPADGADADELAAIKRRAEARSRGGGR